jgi:sortase A
VDYTQASNWFPGGAKKEDFSTSKVDYYTITIPRLKINSATVAIGGEDLSKSLIQYPGTALPGKRGNSVIFGHSILPIFYDPKNYISIFSLLPTLKKGDLIYIDYDGVAYTYRIETMFEVLPTDIQVLDQDSTDSFLTLVTCVPPGDPGDPKRLIVRARVVPPQ